MSIAWRISALLGVTAIVAAILRNRGDALSITGPLTWVAIIGSASILISLHAIYWQAAGQRFGGTNRHRFHVLTAGEIAFFLLLFQIWVIGFTLVLLAAVIYTHNIWKATEHVRLFGPPPKPDKKDNAGQATTAT